MTMPFERTRAVLRTREFLQWVLSAEATSETLMQGKREARALLRHYPSTSNMEIAHHALARCGLARPANAVVQRPQMTLTAQSERQTSHGTSLVWNPRGQSSRYP